jgi:predicted nuclease of restriction endonuclease-like RecB superfamily
MVRGIASVLESRSVFQSRSSIPPLEARRQVFTEAAMKVVASKDERMSVLKAVSERNGLSVSMLEDSLYADLEEEQYLVGFRELSSEELMKYYNYANMVSLLAYSLNLEISYRGSDDYLMNLLKSIKSAKVQGSNKIRAVIELRPTRRFNQRAGRIHEIMNRVIDKPEWSLIASIKYPQRYKTVCTFQIDSRGDGRLLDVDQREEAMIIEISEPAKKASKYGDIVVVDDIALLQGLTSAQVMREIREEGTKYRDLGGVLVSFDKYEEINTHLRRLETLGEAQDYLKSLGVRDFVAVLESFGYQVEWSKPRRDSKIYRL